MTNAPAPGQPGIRLLAVHAHPDDETLATGIALAHHRGQGDDVHVLTATLGEQGEVIPPALVHLEGTDALGPHRRSEMSAAMASLGVHHHWLGGEEVPRWRDSGMAGSSSAAHPRAFAAADVREAAAVLAGQVRAIAPDVVLTYDPTGGYGHPDHIQAHRVTVAALGSLPARTRPAMYVVLVPRSWAEQDREWLAEHVPAGSPLAVPGPTEEHPPSVVPDEQVTHHLLSPQSVAARDDALRHHVTQVRVHQGWFSLSNDVAARLTEREGYARWVFDD